MTIIRIRNHVCDKVPTARALHAWGEIVLGLTVTPATKTHVNEWLSSAPNAVDLAHAVLSQKRAQLRGHLAEAEAELGRAATERELVVLGEVDLGRPSVDRSGRLENEQVVIKGSVQFAVREAHFVLRHR